MTLILHAIIKNNNQRNSENSLCFTGNVVYSLTKLQTHQVEINEWEISSISNRYAVYIRKDILVYFSRAFFFLLDTICESSLCIMMTVNAPSMNFQGNKMKCLVLCALLSENQRNYKLIKLLQTISLH